MSDNTTSITLVASGQKLIIYAILTNLLSVGLQAGLGDVTGLLPSVVALVLALVGMFRLASGLGYATAIKILLVILMVVPLINLVALLILNARATKALRAAGLKVGLLGASANA